MTDQIEVDAFLAHYGVKGMKWGVIRNPDELARAAGRKVKSEVNDLSRVNRAKNNERNAAQFQSEIDKIDAKEKMKRSDRIARRNFVELRDEQLAKAKAKRNGELTPGQKKAIIAGAVIGGCIAAYAGYKIADLGGFSQAGAALRDAVNGAGKGVWKVDPSLAGDLSLDQIKSQVMPRINPGFSEGLPGTRNNCRRCTFAYEVSRRGYDVRATKTIKGLGQTAPGLVRATTDIQDIPTTVGGMALRVGQEAYTKAKDRPLKKTDFTALIENLNGNGQNAVDIFKGEEAKNIFQSLSQYPDRARGELGVQWAPGGGHSVAWEIIGGKPVIMDTQTGKTWSSAAKFQKDYGKDIVSAGHTRLDNIELNEEFLTRWVTNA